MSLRLPDKWVWDSWIADAGRDYHLFYLQAPRSLEEESLRHRNATVGHAVSDDLHTWHVLADVLAPGSAGDWDDLATWTGSAIEHEGSWYLFYTGVSLAGEHVRQGIGLATSDDLATWAKHPANPVLTLDERWYELRGFDAWRDPWVMRDSGGEGFHALITARANHGPADARGVIGHAWSADLVTWEARAPLSEPGHFGHLEVPQVEVIDGTPVLLFSVAFDRFPASWRTGALDQPNTSFVTTGESLLGPWDIAGARPIPVPDLYAARLVRDRAGEWQVIGFRDGSARGEFVGEIIDPVPFSDVMPAEPLRGRARPGPQPGGSM
ncbi:MAG: glycosyl hydrolase family 32 [Candidatus Limnocylindrales bacterium]